MPTVLETGNFDAANQILTKISRIPSNTSSDDWEELRDYAVKATDQCIAAAASYSKSYVIGLLNPLQAIEDLFTSSTPSEQLSKQISKAQNAEAVLGQASQGNELKGAASASIREGFGVLYALGDIPTQNNIGAKLYEDFNSLAVAQSTPSMGPLASTVDNKQSVVDEIGDDLGFSLNFVTDETKKAANAVGSAANNVWENVKDTATNLKNKAVDIVGDVEIIVVVAIVAGVALVAALIYAIAFKGEKVRETAGTVKALKSIF